MASGPTEKRVIMTKTLLEEIPVKHDMIFLYQNYIANARVSRINDEVLYSIENYDFTLPKLNLEEFEIDYDELADELGTNGGMFQYMFPTYKSILQATLSSLQIIKCLTEYAQKSKSSSSLADFYQNVKDGHYFSGALQDRWRKTLGFVWNKILLQKKTFSSSQPDTGVVALCISELKAKLKKKKLGKTTKTKKLMLNASSTETTSVFEFAREILEEFDANGKTLPVEKLSALVTNGGIPFSAFMITRPMIEKYQKIVDQTIQVTRDDIVTRPGWQQLLQNENKNHYDNLLITLLSSNCLNLYVTEVVLPLRNQWDNNGRPQINFIKVVESMREKLLHGHDTLKSVPIHPQSYKAIIELIDSYDVSGQGPQHELTKVNVNKSVSASQSVNTEDDDIRLNQEQVPTRSEPRPLEIRTPLTEINPVKKKPTQTTDSTPLFVIGGAALLGFFLLKN